MSELVRYSVIEHVAVVTIDNPPVNALSPGVPEGIEECFERALADSDVDAILIVGGGKTFIAGADIRQLEKLARGETNRGPRLKQLLIRLEDSTKPVVAGIHGTALGGGLELAMACHYRVAHAKASVGQPEVKLGIIPGAAGTQRLPRLVGIEKAAEMCAIGDPISAQEAFHAGLVDHVIEGDIVEASRAFALERKNRERVRTRDRQEKLVLSPEVERSLDGLRKKVRQWKEPGPALRAIDAVEAAARLSFEEGCNREEELFEESIRSEAAQGLMHVFFGQREVAKIPGLPTSVAPIEVKKVAILGAGTMGTGIVTSYAAAGYTVLWQDESEEALHRGRAQARGFLERLGQKKGLSREAIERMDGSISLTHDYQGMDEVDLVVEAVFENLELKKKIFADLGRIARPGTILASNTSTLDIDAMAEASGRPTWVVGHHFFSPAHVMKLLEIVRGKATSDEVLVTSMNLAKRLGKVGVMVGNARGFVGNRMYGPYQREAQFLVEEGAAPEQVDRAMEAFGMAMGPLAVGDLAGLDVGYRVRQESAHLVPAGWRMPTISDRLCELGRYGQKTGRGWYLYAEGAKSRAIDPEVIPLAEQVAAEQDIIRRTVTDEEIVERILSALVLEGVRVLEEGLALRPVDIDIIYVMGYGFPSHQGGPMFWGDRSGLAGLYERTTRWSQTLGPWWKPPALLGALVESGKTLEEWAREGKRFVSR